MITYIHQHNPFDMSQRIVKEIEGDGLSITQLLKQEIPNFVDFSHPTICQLNDKYILRKNWPSLKLKPKDVIIFIQIVQAPAVVAWAAFIIAIAGAVYSIMNMPKPINSDVSEPDDVYSIKGHRNQNRFGYPIECPYGRNDIYPSIASLSYTSYEGNNQYLYTLLCLGEGAYEKHGVYIDDTPVANFQEIEYEFYEPGELVTLFPDNVTTSTEVSEIELYAPNEDDYAGPSGAFVANDVGTLINRIEIDYALTSGLYFANDKGGLDNLTVTALFEYQQIGNAGSPIGDWQVLNAVDLTMNTVTPQRFTVGINVTDGRYQVRAARTNDKNTSHRSGNTLVWQTLRTFGQSVQNYGNVTMLAMKARATNNLNSKSATTVKVDCTRKLPIYNPLSKTWSEPQATRSPIWAFCDVFRNEYGARLTDNFLALDQMFDLDGLLASRNDYFDWIFDSKTNIWEASKKIARVGRAVPRIVGTRITMVRDSPQVLPKGVFTLDNIKRGTFEWAVQFFEQDEYDSLLVEYMDNDTKQIETVLCILPDGGSENPQELKFEGIKNRAQAYREGMYILASERYLRQSVSFSTGFEGHIPAYGDLISVSYDLPTFGIGGQILNIINLTDGSANVTLSEPVTFEQVASYYINMRNLNGTATGAYACTKVASNVVNIPNFPSSIGMKDGYERPLFQFGKGNEWAQLCRLTNIAPGTGEEVALTTVIYVPIIHSFDGLPVPDYASVPSVPAIPTAPTVTGLRVNLLPNNESLVQITWTPALGAQSYIVQTSADGIYWAEVANITTTFFNINVLQEHLYVRVAAVNAGVGAWATWDGGVGPANAAPPVLDEIELINPFTGTQLGIKWDPVLNASFYRIRVYDADTKGALYREVNTTSLFFTYSSANAKDDGANRRSFYVEVEPGNTFGLSGTPAFISVSNPIPEQLADVTHTLVSQSSSTATVSVQWDINNSPDLVGYRLWLSETSGFTPVLETPDFESVTNSMRIVIDKTELYLVTPPDTTAFRTVPNYYKVAAYDVWTNEVILSPQYTIAAIG